MTETRMSLHGIQPAAYVCKHIVALSAGEADAFVSYEAQHSDDLRNAWCEVCEAHLQAPPVATGRKARFRCPADFTYSVRNVTEHGKRRRDAPAEDSSTAPK